MHRIVVTNSLVFYQRKKLHSQEENVTAERFIRRHGTTPQGTNQYCHRYRPYLRDISIISLNARGETPLIAAVQHGAVTQAALDILWMYYGYDSGYP